MLLQEASTCSGCILSYKAYLRLLMSHLAANLPCLCEVLQDVAHRQHPIRVGDHDVLSKHSKMGPVPEQELRVSEHESLFDFSTPLKSSVGKDTCQAFKRCACVAFSPSTGRENNVSENTTNG
jgi:hypothetical protein